MLTVPPPPLLWLALCLLRDAFIFTMMIRNEDVCVYCICNGMKRLLEGENGMDSSYHVNKTPRSQWGLKMTLSNYVQYKGIFGNPVSLLKNVTTPFDFLSNNRPKGSGNRRADVRNAKQKRGTNAVRRATVCRPIDERTNKQGATSNRWQMRLSPLISHPCLSMPCAI